MGTGMNASMMEAGIDGLKNNLEKLVPGSATHADLAKKVTAHADEAKNLRRLSGRGKIGAGIGLGLAGLGGLGYLMG